MGIRPNDPPWSIFVPRVTGDRNGLQPMINFVASLANVLTFCAGSLGVNPKSNLPQMVRELDQQGRIHFDQCHNIHINKYRTLHENSRPEGSLNLYQMMKAYFEVGFQAAAF